MSQSGFVHINVDRILHETDAAFRVRLESGDEHWIPKSQMADADDYEAGDENCTISITEWIAEQKGIEGD